MTRFTVSDIPFTSHEESGKWIKVIPIADLTLPSISEGKLCGRSHLGMAAAKILDFQFLFLYPTSQSLAP
jgi:hypothetical protein